MSDENDPKTPQPPEPRGMRSAKPTPDLIREIEGLRAELERSRAEVRQSRADVETMRQRLRQLTSVDPLTQTLSRQGIEHALATELKRARRSGMHPVAILLECDNFKRINRRFGHAVGDGVLAEIAGRIQSTLRASDHVARLGVDEFLLVLLDTGYWEAVRIAERIRHKASVPVAGTPRPSRSASVSARSLTCTCRWRKWSSWRRRR